MRLRLVIGTTRLNLAKTDKIDKETLEIIRDGDEVYKDLAQLAEDLPGHSPRFLLLSYPLTLVLITLRVL